MKLKIIYIINMQTSTNECRLKYCNPKKKKIIALTMKQFNDILLPKILINQGRKNPYFRKTFSQKNMVIKFTCNDVCQIQYHH